MRPKKRRSKAINRQIIRNTKCHMHLKLIWTSLSFLEWLKTAQPKRSNKRKRAITTTRRCRVRAKREGELQLQIDKNQVERIFSFILEIKREKLLVKFSDVFVSFILSFSQFGLCQENKLCNYIRVTVNKIDEAIKTDHSKCTWNEQLSWNECEMLIAATFHVQHTHRTFFLLSMWRM